MPDFDINELASKYGSGDSKAPAVNFNIDDLASKYATKKTPGGVEVNPNTGRPQVRITEPKPPISDATPEQSAAINAQPSLQGVPQAAQPFPLSPSVVIPNVASDIVTNLGQGAVTASQGLGDIVNRGELAGGAKKMGLGALQAVTAIPAGIASGAVTEPITQLTGNPDIGERAGFVAGSALPIVPGLSAVSKMRPSNVALKDLVDTISNNGANPENLVKVVQGMKANPRLGPADLNPAALSTGQKLFVTEGDTAKNYLHKASTDRMASSANAVTGAYDVAAGIPVNAVQKLKDLSDAAKKVGTEQINPAIAGAKPVDLSGVVEHIDNILKPGVMKQVTGESTLPFSSTKQALANVKSMITSKTEQLTDPQQLHNLQSALRREAEARMSSADGSQRQLGYALMQVRNKIVDAIDEASPQANGKGSYKPGLSNYRDEKDILNAFTNSYNGVLSSSKKMENLPEFTKQWVDGLTKEEKEAAREGIRLRIRSEMGNARNPSLAGQNIARSDFNQQKMEMLLGKDETKKLLDTLDAERAIANTHNKFIENSQTAMRLAGESKIKIPEKTPPSSGADRLMKLASIVGPEAANFYGTGYAVPGIGLAASLASHGISAGATALKDKAKIALAKERNFQLAKMILPTQGPERDALIKSLEAAIPGPKQSLLRRGAGTLSRLVGP